MYNEDVSKAKEDNSTIRCVLEKYRIRNSAAINEKM